MQRCRTPGACSCTTPTPQCALTVAAQPCALTVPKCCGTGWPSWTAPHAGRTTRRTSAAAAAVERPAGRQAPVSQASKQNRRCDANSCIQTILCSMKSPKVPCAAETDTAGQPQPRAPDRSLCSVKDWLLKHSPVCVPINLDTAESASQPASQLGSSRPALSGDRKEAQPRASPGAPPSLRCRRLPPQGLRWCRCSVSACRVLSYPQTSSQSPPSPNSSSAATAGCCCRSRPGTEAASTLSLQSPSGAACSGPQRWWCGLTHAAAAAVAAPAPP